MPITVSLLAAAFRKIKLTNPPKYRKDKIPLLSDNRVGVPSARTLPHEENGLVKPTRNDIAVYANSKVGKTYQKNYELVKLHRAKMDQRKKQKDAAKERKDAKSKVKSKPTAKKSAAKKSNKVTVDLGKKTVEIKSANAKKKRKGNPCWTGYRRTPGTKRGTKGSCQKASSDDIHAGGPGSGEYIHKKKLITAPVKIKTKQIKNRAGLTEKQQALRRELARIKTSQEKRTRRAAQGSLTAKQQIALKHTVTATKEHQDKAEEVEHLIAHHTKGEQQSNNSAMDVVAKGRKHLHGIEVKTLLMQKNDKITMSKSAMKRKTDWLKQNKSAKMHTVAVDLRGKKPVIYHREGVGSFRVGSMTKLKGFSELHRMFD